MFAFLGIAHCAHNSGRGEQGTEFTPVPEKQRRVNALGLLGSWLTFILGIFMMAILCAHPQIALLPSLCIQELGSISVQDFSFLNFFFF